MFKRKAIWKKDIEWIDVKEWDIIESVNKQKWIWYVVYDDYYCAFRWKYSLKYSGSSPVVDFFPCKIIWTLPKNKKIIQELDEIADKKIVVYDISDCRPIHKRWKKW